MDRDSEFQISQNHLDVEWLRQAELMHGYCLQLAEAKLELNTAKATLDVVAAETDKDIRLHPSRYGLDKLSEPRIANAVLLADAHKTASKEVIKRQHDVDVINAAVNALEHKKRALENLVHLHQLSYYSEPRSGDEYAEDMVKRNARSRGAKKSK